MDGFHVYSSFPVHCLTLVRQTILSTNAAVNITKLCCYRLKYSQKAERKPLKFSFFYLGLDFSWQIGEVEDWPEVHKLFDVVHLSCSADDSVKPMPAISIWAGFDELPHKELVNSFE